MRLLLEMLEEGETRGTVAAGLVGLHALGVELSARRLFPALRRLTLLEEEGDSGAHALSLRPETVAVAARGLLRPSVLAAAAAAPVAYLLRLVERCARSRAVDDDDDGGGGGGGGGPKQRAAELDRALRKVAGPAWPLEAVLLRCADHLAEAPLAASALNKELAFVALGALARFPEVLRQRETFVGTLLEQVRAAFLPGEPAAAAAAAAVPPPPPARRSQALLQPAETWRIADMRARCVGDAGEGEGGGGRAWSPPPAERAAAVLAVYAACGWVDVRVVDAVGRWVVGRRTYLNDVRTGHLMRLATGLAQAHSVAGETDDATAAREERLLLMRHSLRVVSKRLVEEETADLHPRAVLGLLRAYMTAGVADADVVEELGRNILMMGDGGGGSDSSSGGVAGEETASSSVDGGGGNDALSQELLVALLRCALWANAERGGVVFAAVVKALCVRLMAMSAGAGGGGVLSQDTAGAVCAAYVAEASRAGGASKAPRALAALAARVRATASRDVVALYNTSLRTLSAVLSAYALDGAADPPLHDALLTVVAWRILRAAPKPNEDEGEGGREDAPPKTRDGLGPAAGHASKDSTGAEATVLPGVVRAATPEGVLRGWRGVEPAAAATASLAELRILLGAMDRLGLENDVVRTHVEGLVAARRGSCGGDVGGGGGGGGEAAAEAAADASADASQALLSEPGLFSRYTDVPFLFPLPASSPSPRRGRGAGGREC